MKDIDRKLKKLPVVTGKKVIRQSMRAGLKLVQAETKSQVPVDTGLTKKNVKLRAVKKRKRGSIALEVRVANAEGLVVHPPFGKPVFYPAIVEYGRKNRQADPFMHRSFAAKGEPARQTTLHEIRDGVEREARKL